MSQQMPEQIPAQMFALVMKKSKNFEVLFPRNSNQEGAIPALSMEKSLALSWARVPCATGFKHLVESLLKSFLSSKNNVEPVYLTARK